MSAETPEFAGALVHLPGYPEEVLVSGVEVDSALGVDPLIQFIGCPAQGETTPGVSRGSAPNDADGVDLAILQHSDILRSRPDGERTAIRAEAPYTFSSDGKHGADLQPLLGGALSLEGQRPRPHLTCCQRGGARTSAAREGCRREQQEGGQKQGTHGQSVGRRPCDALLALRVPTGLNCPSTRKQRMGSATGAGPCQPHHLPAEQRQQQASSLAW